MLKGRSKHSLVIVVVLFIVLSGAAASQVFSQDVLDAAVDGTIGTAFTYQGYLTQDGAEVNGSIDLSFGLYDHLGTPVTGTITQTVTVWNGQLTTMLDFGDVFHGDALWLEVGVKPHGDPGEFDKFDDILYQLGPIRHSWKEALLHVNDH